MSILRTGYRAFLLVWTGQLVSLLGSGLTGFAFGVWVFQRTGSATLFAIIALSATLPSILLSPVAGVLVDRWDRRRVMIFSDMAAALATLTLALIYYLGQLEVWHIILMSTLASSFGAFQRPAWTASVTLLVPKDQFARASGLAQLAQALSHLLAPLGAGLLMGIIGITGIILIDFATFLFALATLLLVRIPRPERPDGDEPRRSMRREAAFGWTWLRGRPGLFRMLLIFAGVNFLFGMVNALLTPMVLSFTGAKELGGLISFGGLGMLAGGILLSVWGGPRRKVPVVLAGLVLVGLFIALTGLRASLWTIGAGLFGILFVGPFLGGLSQAVWQVKVPPGLQGRVFATRNMISMAALPLAYLISGPLADRVFLPLMIEGGALAPVFGPWVGVGPGRGIGLMFLGTGILIALLGLFSFTDRCVRRVELELPDAVGDTPPGEERDD